MKICASSDKVFVGVDDVADSFIDGKAIVKYYGKWGFVVKQCVYVVDELDYMVKLKRQEEEEDNIYSV